MPNKKSKSSPVESPTSSPAFGPKAVTPSGYTAAESPPNARSKANTAEVVQLKSDDFSLTDDDMIYKMKEKLAREGNAERLYGMGIVRDEKAKTVVITATLYPKE